MNGNLLELKSKVLTVFEELYITALPDGRRVKLIVGSNNQDDCHCRLAVGQSVEYNKYRIRLVSLVCEELDKEVFKILVSKI